MAKRRISAREKFRRSIRNPNLEESWSKEGKIIRRLNVGRSEIAVEYYDPYQTRNCTHLIHTHPSGSALPSPTDLWNFIHPASHNIMQRKMTIIASSPRRAIFGYFTILMPKNIYNRKTALYKDKQPPFFENFDDEMRLFKKFEPAIAEIRDNWPQKLVPSSAEILKFLEIMRKHGLQIPIFTNARICI